MGRNGTDRWQNRIVGEDVVDADQLLANPTNWRIHPKHQQAALAGVLDNVGWVQRVIVNQRTGHVIDGHLRASLAISRGEQVPVIYVDVDEDEERLILATLDPLAAMAATDAEMLEDLLRGLGDTPLVQDDEGLTALLDAVGRGVTQPGADDWAAAFGGLPDGDRAPFQQMTFTLHDDQAETVRAALAQAKRDCDLTGMDNENSNGNALYMICRAYVDGFS